MRVRITKALTGSIDGIQLSRLRQGQVYDVNTSLACYLLSEEMAEPATNGEPARRLPDTGSKKEGAPRPVEMRKGIVLPRSMAADRRHRKKQNKRKE
jgi:hypothetical protein